LVLADGLHLQDGVHLKLGKILSLAVFLMVLFASSGQRLYSQWELIDTVWTNRYHFFDGDHTSFISPNDSLLTHVLYLINSSTGQGFADDEFYDKDDYINSQINCFMSDTTFLVMKTITGSGANPYDTAKVYDFKNHRYMGIFDIKSLSIPYGEVTRNKNLYSKYDNCIYGFTQKMNMTTGEITNLTDWYYLHGYSISPDGTILAGYEWYRINNGTYRLANKFISLETRELIYQDEHNYNGTGSEYTGTVEYYFSEDNRYVGGHAVYDLQEKKVILSLTAGTDENGMKYSYTRPIFSKSSKKVLSLKLYRDNVKYATTDSILFSVIDLTTLRETLYPINLSEGVVFGEPKAFIFDDSYIICDGASKYVYKDKYYQQQYVASSSMLKLKFDVNGVSTEPEEIESVIYPNPTNGEAIIKFLEPINFPTHLQVSNTNGEIVFTDELQVGILEYRLNTLGWQSGTYYIMTSTETGSKTYKLILNK